ATDRCKCGHKQETRPREVFRSLREIQLRLLSHHGSVRSDSRRSAKTPFSSRDCNNDNHRANERITSPTSHPIPRHRPCAPLQTPTSLPTPNVNLIPAQKPDIRT